MKTVNNLSLNVVLITLNFLLKFFVRITENIDLTYHLYKFWFTSSYVRALEMFQLILEDHISAGQFGPRFPVTIPAGILSTYRGNIFAVEYWKFEKWWKSVSSRKTL